MLITGILAFGFGTFSIVILRLPYQWFGFIGGALLIWMFFNIDRFNKTQEQLKS